MENGLSNNTVLSIAQDDDGFLWFGTLDGLNRFDGQNFTAFYHRADGTGLPTNKISSLQALSGHRLLIGTTEGLTVMDTRQLTFEHLTLPARPGFGKNDGTVCTILQDSGGRIWVGGDKAIHVLNDHLDVLSTVFAPDARPEIPYYLARELFELPDGRVIFSRNRSWLLPDFERQKIDTLARVSPELGILDSVHYQQCIASEGKTAIWLVGGHYQYSRYKVHRLDWATKTAQRFLPHQPFAKDQHFFPVLLPDSLLFLQTYFGKAVVFDLRNQQTVELDYWDFSAPDGALATTFLDRDRNFWVCPKGGGIWFFPLRQSPVRPLDAVNVAHQKNMGPLFADQWFGFSAIENRGKWLFGSGFGGFYGFDPMTRQTRFFGSGQNNPLGYAYNFIPFRGDTVWLSTLDGNYWLNTKNYSVGKLAQPGMDSVTTNFLFRDSRGLIWGMVYRNGVACLNSNNGQFQHFGSKGDHAPFPLTSATAVAEDMDGNLWFAYTRETRFLAKWHRETGVFEKVEPRKTGSLSGVAAYRMSVDRAGNLWLLTADGMFRFDLKTGGIHAFGKENGLNSNQINGWAFDKKGDMWFATPLGLSRLGQKNGQITTFYTSDGLLSNAIFGVDLLDTARNLLFVSTDRGLCLFEPDKLTVNLRLPQMYLTGLRVGDRAVPLPENGELKLSFQENDLTLEFTGINFLDGNRNRYQFRLDGADNDHWTDGGGSKSATYLNLPPGNYTFRARAANGDGFFSEREAVLKITVLPPFWATATFRLAVLALLAAVGFWFYRRQIRQIETREKEKAKIRQELANLEMKALRAQMNPHFVFNALSSVQNFVLKNNTVEASRYLTKFARLMRLILENSESPVVLLAREIELLKHYTALEALRFNQHFSVDFQIDEKLDTESVSIPGMLIQPHIENAIWHGLMHKSEAGRLQIRFLKTGEKTISCEIEDDGVGRVQSGILEKNRPRSDHRSTGLANIQSRLELLKDQLTGDIRLEILDLTDENGAARGTKVVVQMPVIG